MMLDGIPIDDEHIITIEKLEKLMLKMDKNQFIIFINSIYDKRQYMIYYDIINNREEEYSIKSKVKSIVRKCK